MEQHITEPSEDEELSLLNDTSIGGYSADGLKEMDEFCRKTLQALSEIENERQTEPLSIDSLARVDISLFRAENGSLSYYVNEITRPVTATALMAHLAGQSTNIEVMAAHVRMGLIECYLHHRKKFPALQRFLQ